MGRDENLFEGKSLDEAVRKGLDALGLARAEVIITVVDEGTGGFLGLGARPYRVRVVPRPGGPPRDLDTRSDEGRARHSRGGRDRQGRGRDDRRGGRDRNDRPARVAAGDRGPRAERTGGGARGERGGRGGRAGRDRDRGGRGGERGDRPSDRADRGDRPIEMRPAPVVNDRPPEPGARPAPFEGRAGGGDAGRRRRRRGGRGRGGEGPREPMRGPEPMHQEVRDESMPPDRDDTMRDMREDGEDRGDTMRGGRGDSVRGDRGERGMRPERGDRGDRGESTGGESRRYAATPGAYGETSAPEPGAVATASAESGGPSMPAAELEQQSVAITTELLSAMGYDASVSATADGTRVEVRAVVPTGEEELTGRKGEVRQALQHLLNRMLNRGRVSEYHLQLEINDFWQRREEELRQQAQDLAEEALAEQREAVTEYLNAQERRIIHVALKEDARVKTYALGTGLIKRVAVAPADFPEQPRYEE